MKPQRELPTLAIALLASLVLWNLPQGGLLLYPFKLLATWAHELSHGIAMLVTGTGFSHIDIFRDTSGIAHARSGAGPAAMTLIAAAGYMGTPLWGALLLVATPNAEAARRALLVIAALLGASALLAVGNEFGQGACGAIAVAFAVAAFVPPRARLFVAHFVAAQACVDAVLDIRVLLRPLQVVDGKAVGVSDATNMAMATFGTTAGWAVWLWALVWLAWSLAVLFVALRVVTRRRLQVEDALDVRGDVRDAGPGVQDRDDPVS